MIATSCSFVLGRLSGGAANSPSAGIAHHADLDLLAIMPLVSAAGRRVLQLSLYWMSLYLPVFRQVLLQETELLQGRRRRSRCSWCVLCADANLERLGARLSGCNAMTAPRSRER